VSLNSAFGQDPDHGGQADVPIDNDKCITPAEAE
jgi:hypothetical protein